MPPVATDTLARTLEDHAGTVRAAWLEAAAAELHGRTTRGELEREQSDILDALLDGLRAGGTVLSDPAFDQVRGILADVSAARARLGFTPRETAVGVFALKEGLYRLTSDEAVTVDVVSEKPDGTRAVVSHFNKAHKGRLARALVSSRAEPDDAAQVAAIATRAGMQVERDGNKLTVVVPA